MRTKRPDAARVSIERAAGRVGAGSGPRAARGLRAGSSLGRPGAAKIPCSTVRGVRPRCATCGAGDRGCGWGTLVVQGYLGRGRPGSHASSAF